MSIIKIMIDPGHGGSDRANKGHNGYIEADGVLDISLRLRDKLSTTGAFEIKMTRDTDMSLGVRERGEMAANWGAQLLISEHTNALDGKTRGVEVFESVDLNDEDFAAEMSKAISVALGIPNRGGKQWESTKFPGEDYLGVIDAAQDGGVPHILLIESAFHDNVLDEAILLDPSKRDIIADVQAQIICWKFGVKYPKFGIPDNKTTAPWKVAGTEYLRKMGYITSDHCPTEPIDMGTLGTILMNYDKINRK